MNPARSCDRITRLPRPSTMKSSARSATSLLVTIDGMSSTRRITGTGLKKCSPTTCSARPLATASFMIGMDDVFVELARLHRLAQRGLDAGATGRDRSVVDVADGDVGARLRRDLGDPRAHESGADDADAFDGLAHAVPPSAPWARMVAAVYGS